MLVRGLLVASIAACSATATVQAPPRPPTPRLLPRPQPALRQVAALATPAAVRPDDEPSFLDDPAPPSEAVATIAPIRGSHARGTVTLRALADDSVEVAATIDNLPGPHSYRVHATADCSGAELGVLGDLVDRGGITTTHRTTIERPLRSLIGRSIAIHAERRDDDHPAYADRVACGVIAPAR
jgi:Cu/Zn superoxide dismutase